MKRLLLIVAACLVVASPAHASTATQIKQLQKQQKATAAQVKQLRADLTRTRRELATAQKTANAVAYLLTNCFLSTSFDLDAASSYFTGAPFITTALNTTNAGPFYLATLAAPCVGAITPMPSGARSTRPLFPMAHLPLPTLPE